MNYSFFEDTIQLQNSTQEKVNQYSPYCDLIYYSSSVTKGIVLAMLVKKPKNPSRILATTHGWHMSMPEFVPMTEPEEDLDFLQIHVDMRGRAFSDGKPDCNGLELMDVIDAVEYVKRHYQSYIKDQDLVYFRSGSGGGGNAFAIIGKFPDYFAHCTALYGISDYSLWYNNDSVGEFRDELCVWVGKSPDENPEGYRSRGGITTVSNQLTPLCIVHGAKDERVPVEHSRIYFEKADKNITVYYEFENIGDQRHLGNATEDQLAQIPKLIRQHQKTAEKPINIPTKGTFVVAGYLVTKKFSVFLDSIDAVATLYYDLDKEEFRIESENKVGFTVKRFI